MENKLRKLILSGEFLKAKPLVKEINQERLDTILSKIGYDEESICAYSFICFLIKDNETVEYHLLACGLMQTALCHLTGAYQCALYHARRVVEMCPNDMEAKENLLFFYRLPEKLINDEEAKSIVDAVLKKNPESPIAKSVFDDYFSKNTK